MTRLHLSRFLLVAGLISAPSLVHAQAGGGIGITSAPACSIENNLTPVSVRVGLNGGAVTPTNGTGSAGSVRIVCNTLRAAVFIGSNAMVNTAPILASEADNFANRIDFAAYARPRFLGVFGWQIASRPGVRGAWQSDYVFTRIMNIDVFATNFETLTKMPVAGDYKGQICITVSPSGLPAPTRAQGTAGCGSGPS
jgi:hypothetical protein